MKKCVLVNCFASSNEMRVEPIRNWFDAQGYETVYLSSDFNHAKKEYVKLDEGIVGIHVRGYQKNISIRRLLSHMEFSWEIYKRFKKEKPDVLYVKFPPNSLAYVASKYRKKYSCKLIFDLFDLWPEALPIESSRKKLFMPILKIWAFPRNVSMRFADIFFTECNMYRHVLARRLPRNTATLYLMKKDVKYCYSESNVDAYGVCYLGGINNLIDISMVGEVLRQLSMKRKTILHIIGDGDKRNVLIEVAERSGCKVNYHGIIYDEDQKYQIMRTCDFGLNVVKKDGLIALSIKSIEYFRAGLAVINTVKSDTWKIIEKGNAGINICNIDDFNIDGKNVGKMKMNSRRIYEAMFSEKAFNAALNESLPRVLI